MMAVLIMMMKLLTLSRPIFSFFIQTKTVRIFPNNKPWITKEQKGILNEKKHVFLNGDCISV